MDDLSHWQMYTDKANKALEKHVQGLLKVKDRLALGDAVRMMQKRMDSIGFGEVYDTEPEWEIVDWVNKHICEPRKWLSISRDEF